MSDAYEGQSLFNQRRREHLDRQREALAGMSYLFPEPEDPFKLRYSDAQYRELRSMIENERIDEDELWRLNAAMAVSQNYGIPLTEARQNLDAYTQAITGMRVSESRPMAWYRGLASAVKKAWQNWQHTDAVKVLMELETSGGDEELIKKTYNRLHDLERQMEQHTDADPNLLVRTLEEVIETTPYSVYVGAFNALGGLVGSVAGPAGSFVGSRIAGTWAAADRETASEYYALRKAGIDVDIAKKVAPLAGTAGGAIESFLDEGAGLFAKGFGKIFGGLSKPLSERITGMVLKGMRSDGVFLSWAVNTGGRSVTGAAMEGLEEAGGSLSSSLFHNYAATLQNERIYAEVLAELKTGGLGDGEARETLNGMITALRKGGEMPDTGAAGTLRERYVPQKEAAEIVREMGDSFVTGARVGFVFGTANTAVSSLATLRDLKRIRAEAVLTPSEKAFYEKVKNKPAFAHLSEEGKKESIGKLHKAVQDQIGKDQAALAEELKQTKGLGEGYAQPETNPDTQEEIPLGKAFKEKNGTYYAKMDEGKGIYKVGDRRMDTRSNLWSDIQFHRDGGKVVIDSFSVRPDLDTPEFRREVYGQFAEHFAGRDISWDPAPGPQADIKNDLVKYNPLGEQAGLNYFSAEDAEGGIEGARYRNRVIDTLARYFPASSSEEHAVMAAEWEAMAAARGLSLEAYVNQEFGSLETAFTTEQNRDIYAAAKEGKNVKGAVSFGGDLARDAKAAIYVSRNADLSTFIHEMAHIYRRRLDGGLLAEAERIWGKFDRKAEEQFAEDFEAWRREGKAPRPEMESFFKKFAEFLKKIYNAVSGRGPVSEEVRAFFEQLYAEEAREGPGGAQAQNGTAEAGGTRREAAAAQQEAENAGGDIDYTGTEETKRKYEEAPGLRGAEGKKRVAGRKLSGHYEIKAAGSATASFDPAKGFENSTGFWRHRSDGSSLNRRNYAGEQTEQAATLKIASRYSGAALGGIVLYEGKTISGNGREGAGQIAARQNTDGEYIEDLLDDAEKYGFTREQVEQFIRETDPHPRLYFVVDETLEINDQLFADFNLSSRKAQNTLETAVNISKQIRPETVARISEAIAEHDGIEELHKDKKALRDIFNILTAERLIGEFDTPQYFTEKEGLSGAGEDLLAAVTLGAVLDEGNIRKLQGAKSIRDKLLKAVPALVENKAMGEYGVAPELNRAVGIAVEVAANPKTYSGVEDYARQQKLDLGERVDTDIEIEFARRLAEGKKDDFAVELMGLNAVLAEASRGQADIFAGGVESRESIIRRYLGIRARVEEIRERNGKILKDPAAGRAEKAQAALDDAGIARAEAEGTLYQIMGEDIEEIREDARMPRNAQSLTEAEAIAKDKENGFIGKPITNRRFNITATVSGKSLSEMTNEKQVRKAVSPRLQAKAVANADMLFERAIVHAAHPDTHGRENVKQVHRFGTLMEDGGDYVPVKITVIEYGQDDFGNRLYTIEAVDIEKMKSAGLLPQTPENPEASGPIADFNNRLIELAGYVKGNENPDTLFQTEIDLLEEAAAYGSWQEFRDAYEGSSAVPSDADNAWYETFFRDARKAYPKESPRTLFQEGEEAAPSRAEELDRRWMATETTREKLAEILKRIHAIFNSPDAEPAAAKEASKEGWREEGPEELEARNKNENTLRLKGRLERELPRPGKWKGYAANVATGTPLKESWYKDLKRLIREAPRDYRALFADIMGQSEYLEDLADTIDGEPAASLADPRGKPEDVKGAIKRIVRELGDEEIASLVASGDVKMYDVLEEAYAAGRERALKESEAALKGLNAEAAEDWGRFAGQEQRDLIDAYDQMLVRREAYKNTRDAISRDMEKNLSISRQYKRQARLEKADYDRAMKAYLDLKKVMTLEADVREALGRREAAAAERLRQTGMTRVMRALRALKEMKKRIIKRIVRNVAYERVNYEQAVIVKAVQRLITPSISKDVQRWIGPADGAKIRELWTLWNEDKGKEQQEFIPSLRKAAGERAEEAAAILDKPWEQITGKDKRNLLGMLSTKGWVRDPAFLVRVLWSRWKTDQEKFAPEFMRAAGDRAKDIAAVLDKPWEKITDQDKRDVLDMMPQENWVRDLGLRELERKNRESAQLDIEERLVDGKVEIQVGEELQRRIIEAIGEELYSRILNKPLKEWSIAEAEELARAVDRLVVEGKKQRAAERLAFKEKTEEYQAKIREAMKKTKWAIQEGDSPEEKERKRKKQAELLGRYASGQKNHLWNNFFDASMRRFTTAMDGGRKGIFTNLLYWGENDAYNAKYRAMAARQELVDRVMKDHRVTLEELYTAVEIPGLDLTGLDILRVNGGRPLTVDDLLYIMRGEKNEFTRDAIMYGDLSNAAERAKYEKEEKGLENPEEFANLAEGRLKKILDFAGTFFAREENKKFLALAEAVGEDYERNGERLNRVMIEMFNRPMWRQDNYVPMNRWNQSGGENENRVIEDFLGVTGAGTKWVNRGMTEKRIPISPYHQAAIEIGLYKTWAGSVEATEHLAAYGPLLQRLNAVFKGYYSADTRQALTNRWGTVAAKYIDNALAEMANPNPSRQRSELDKLMRDLRGKFATAVLAWRISGVLKQLATSPWPYLQEVSVPEYLSAALRMAGRYKELSATIREKSVFMRNRDFDPMVKLIREQMAKTDSKLGHGIDKFNTMGMKGLATVDWACVAPGWLAVYEHQLARLTEEREVAYAAKLAEYHGAEWAEALPTEEAKVQKALEETKGPDAVEREAVALADDAVRRMQPSSRSTDLAPLFKGNNEVGAALLQFQSSLSNIWQNLRYDLPLAVKEKQIGTIAGMVTGYVMAGVCVGILTGEVWDGEDDDEEVSAARKLVFHALTQFSDSVPVIGDAVTTLLERLITGRPGFRMSGNLLPVVEKAFGGLGNLAALPWEEDDEKQKERARKAFLNALEAFMTWRGLPVSGVKELGRATGIGDWDGEFEFNPEAFLGWRK